MEKYWEKSGNDEHKKKVEGERKEKFENTMDSYWAKREEAKETPEDKKDE